MTFGSVFGRTFSPTFQPSSQAAAGTLTVGTVADTWLKNEGTKSYGGSTTMDCTKAVFSLVRFDLSSIPASATCVSAYMTLTSAMTTWSGRTAWYYEIASANGDWVEGTANAATQTGASCYPYKITSTSAWAGSAGLRTAGTDYVNTILTSYSTTGQTDAGTAFTFTFNASGLAVVESWFGQATNSGLIGWANDIFRFYTKEHATESYRPTLTVTYE